MEVKKTGKYVFVKDHYDRGTSCCGTIPSGTIIDITQIDEIRHKVISPGLYDWTYWDLPVRPVHPDGLISEST